MNAAGKNFKQKIVHELYLFFIYAAFLTLFFCSLSTYRRLILGEYSISYLHYGYGLVQGLVLSKIILIGEVLKLGEKYAHKSLIIPTLYKTVIFTFFALAFIVLEHFVTGYIHGLNSAKIYQEFIDKGLDEALARILVIFIVFILFFAFIETARVMGEGKFINLFFKRKTKDDSDFSNRL